MPAVSRLSLLPTVQNLQDHTPMTDPTTPTDSTAYQALIDYFSNSKSIDLTPIAHPDSSINKMVDGHEKSLRKAAVLIPVTRPQADRKSQIILTVRAENLRSHAGQISLPGGTSEAQDADAIATALRESEEEIGLRAEQVEVIGQLGDMALPSGFQVTPIVGLIESGLSFTPCPIEVAELFQAPLDLILDMTAYTTSVMTFDEKPRKILELYYEDYRIWGATAAILYHLAKEVSKSRE